MYRMFGTYSHKIWFAFTFKNVYVSVILFACMYISEYFKKNLIKTWEVEEIIHRNKNQYNIC